MDVGLQRGRKGSPFGRSFSAVVRAVGLGRRLPYRDNQGPQQFPRSRQALAPLAHPSVLPRSRGSSKEIPAGSEPLQDPYCSGAVQSFGESHPERDKFGLEREALGQQLWRVNRADAGVSHRLTRRRRTYEAGKLAGRLESLRKPPLTPQESLSASEVAQHKPRSEVGREGRHEVRRIGKLSTRFTEEASLESAKQRLAALEMSANLRQRTATASRFPYHSKRSHKSDRSIKHLAQSKRYSAAAGT